MFKTGLALFFLSILAGGLAFLFFTPKHVGDVETKTFSPEPLKTAQADAVPQDDDAWLEGADIKNGYQLSRICVACHTFDEGGPRRFAPNLFNIIGTNYAHDKGYAYSNALKALSHKKWTARDMDKWIQNPAKFVPGTNMLFNGLSEAEHRRDLVAYIKSLK